VSGHQSRGKPPGLESETVMAHDPSGKLIVFDVDGTLVDSQDMIVQAMNWAFEQAGYPAPTRTATLGIVGLSLPQAMGALLPEADDAQCQSLARLYSQSFVAMREQTGGEAGAPLYEGARACIERLHGAGYVLSIATGKARRGLDHFLHSHELDRFFTVSQCADDAPSKPHPGMVLNCLSATGIAPAHAVMIGDTSFDMEMGRGAGCHTVAVGWGYHTAERLGMACPNRMVTEFADIDAALHQIWGEP